MLFCMNKDTAAYVHGSVAFTPQSMLVMRRVSPADATRPPATPAIASFPARPKTIRRMNRCHRFKSDLYN